MTSTVPAQRQSKPVYCAQIPVFARANAAQSQKDVIRLLFVKVFLKKYKEIFGLGS